VNTSRGGSLPGSPPPAAAEVVDNGRVDQVEPFESISEGVRAKVRRTPGPPVTVPKAALVASDAPKAALGARDAEATELALAYLTSSEKPGT
jgi:hypothetical protein